MDRRTLQAGSGEIVMVRIGLFIILYGLIPAVQSYLYIIDLAFVTPASALNYIFSIFSYYAVFSHLLISVKIPRMQHILPYDRMIKFHALSGILLTLAIYYHGAFKLLSGKELEGTSIMLFFLWTFLLFLAVIWIETPFSRSIRNALLKRFVVLKRIPYDLLKGIHEYLFFAFAIITFIHINESDLLYSSYSFITVYGSGFPIAVLALVLYGRLRRFFFPRFTVMSVRNEADTLVLTLSSAGKHSLRYRSGQFGYLKVLKKGMNREEHPFSFLSHAHEKEVMLGIKSLGDFTRSIQALLPGDTVSINGGFGNFIPSADEKPKVFIGSGIGIVPLVSLVREMRHIPPKGVTDVFLAVTLREELLFEEELKELEKTIGNLNLHLYVYKEDGILYTSELFRQAIGNPEQAHYFICSSPGVREIVTSALTSIGASKKQIHFEAFSY